VKEKINNTMVWGIHGYEPHCKWTAGNNSLCALVRLTYFSHLRITTALYNLEKSINNLLYFRVDGMITFDNTTKSNQKIPQ